MKEVQTQLCCGTKTDNQIDLFNDYHYMIQVGIFQTYNKAMSYQLQLMEEGYLVDIDRQGELFGVYAGNFTQLDEAVILEKYLRLRGLNTLIIAKR